MLLKTWIDIVFQSFCNSKNELILNPSISDFFFQKFNPDEKFVDYFYKAINILLRGQMLNNFDIEN